MMRTAILLMFLALPVQAQVSLPAFFDVIDVADNDVLNVREAPDADAAIIGMYGPNSVEIEVIRTEGNWGLVNMDGGPGWASLSYLAPHEVATYSTAIERPISCVGTEPFWSFTHVPHEFADIQQSSGMAETFDNPELLIPLGYSPNSGFVSAQNDTVHLTAFIELQACGDGMSDREFGMRINMLIEGDPELGSSYALLGCCSLISPP